MCQQGLRVSPSAGLNLHSTVVFLAWFLVFWSSSSSYALEITHFHVPRFVDRKDQVVLDCRFRMSASERLHSVKWYRTDHSGNMEEFYTFQPSRQPPAKTYKRKGIRVDMRQSNIHRVLLDKVSLATSGTYRCEVTSKNPPRFDAKVREGKMVVLKLLDTGPVISGGLIDYRIGDRLVLNCTSPKTYPPTRLKWLINGKERSASHPSTWEYPMRLGSKSGLYKSTIGINTTLSRSMFSYGGSIRIECVGEIDDTDMVEGSFVRANEHNLETVRLPAALKRERKQLYVVPMINKAGLLQPTMIFWPMVAVITVASRLGL